MTGAQSGRWRSHLHESAAQRSCEISGDTQLSWSWRRMRAKQIGTEGRGREFGLSMAQGTWVANRAVHADCQAQISPKLWRFDQAGSAAFVGAYRCSGARRPSVCAKARTPASPIPGSGPGARMPCAGCTSRSGARVRSAGPVPAREDVCRGSTRARHACMSGAQRRVRHGARRV